MFLVVPLVAFMGKPTKVNMGHRTTKLLKSTSPEGTLASCLAKLYIYRLIKIKFTTTITMCQ